MNLEKPSAEEIEAYNLLNAPNNTNSMSVKNSVPNPTTANVDVSEVTRSLNDVSVDASKQDKDILGGSAGGEGAECVCGVRGERERGGGISGAIQEVVER